MQGLAASSTWRLPLLAVLLASTTAAQRETFVPASDVSFSISTERTSYKAGDEILLHFSIVNTSPKPVYAPREWAAKCRPSPHVRAWFENSDGKHFIPGYAGSCSPLGQPKTVTDRMGKEAVLLQPNQHFDGTFRLDSRMFGIAAGQYRIEAELPGWREQDFTATESSEFDKNGRGLLNRRSAGFDPRDTDPLDRRVLDSCFSCPQ
jgi:hypothetical protein